jgi:hypothetical protein
MTMVSDSLIRHLYFGFDREHLLIRCDTADRAKTDLAMCDEFRVRFVEPYGLEAKFDLRNPPAVSGKLTREGLDMPLNGVQGGLDRILEVSIPLKSLGIEPGHTVQFAVELYEGGESIGRTPAEGTIETMAPKADFENKNWQA